MLFPIGLSIVGARRPARHRSPDAVRRFAIEHDAGDVVRRVGRRHGDAGRHAAEPDRHGPHRAARRRAGELPRLDAARRAAGPGDVRAPPRLVRLVGRPRPAHRSRRPGAGPRGAGPGSGRGRAASATSSSAFAVAVFLWIAPGLAAIVGQDGSRAMQAFATSVPEASPRSSARCCCSCCRSTGGQRRFTLTWDQAAGIDWGIILLYGGGLALGDLAFETGLAGARLGADVGGCRRTRNWR